MDDTQKAFNIVRLSRSPGFREMVELLDAIVKQVCDEAFNCTDESRALRLLHEGRGAVQVVKRLKSEIALLTQTAQENTLA
jgi:hypothetical protein